MPLTLPLKLPGKEGSSGGTRASVKEGAFTDFVRVASLHGDTKLLHNIIHGDACKDRADLVTKRRVALSSLAEFVDAGSVRRHAITKTVESYMQVLSAFVRATHDRSSPSKWSVLCPFSWYDHHEMIQLRMYDARYELACVAYNIMVMKLLRAKDIVYALNTVSGWEPKAVQMLYEEALLAYLTMENAADGLALSHPMEAIPRDLHKSTLYTYRLVVFSCYQLWLSVMCVHNRPGHRLTGDDYKMAAMLFCGTRRMLESLYSRVSGRSTPSPTTELAVYSLPLWHYSALWGYASLELYMEMDSGCMIGTRHAYAKRAAESGNALVALVPKVNVPANQPVTEAERFEAHRNPNWRRPLVIKRIPDFLMSLSTYKMRETMENTAMTLGAHLNLMNSGESGSPCDMETTLNVVDISDTLTKKVQDLYHLERNTVSKFAWMSVVRACASAGKCRDDVYVEWSTVVNKEQRAAFHSSSRSVTSVMHTIGYPEMCDFMGARKQIVASDMSAHIRSMLDRALEIASSPALAEWAEKGPPVSDEDMEAIIAGHGCSEMVTFMDMLTWLKEKASLVQKKDLLQVFSDLVRATSLEHELMEKPTGVLVMQDTDVSLATECMLMVTTLDTMWERAQSLYDSLQVRMDGFPQSVQDMKETYASLQEIYAKLDDLKIQLEQFVNSNAWSCDTRTAMELVRVYKRADAVLRYAEYLELLAMSSA